MKPKIAVIIPVFNEGASIIKVVKKIPAYIDFVVIVDDCSTDGSVNLLKTRFNNLLKRTKPKFIIKRLEKNSGVGGATLYGFYVAINLKADILIKMDGDDQMDPKYIPALLYPLLKENYDLTKGNRLSSFSSIKGMPKSRILGNILLTWINKIISGLWHISDPQNGFIAIKSNALKKIDITKLNSRYAFENTLLIESNNKKLSVKDVPMVSRYGNETSHIQVKNFITTNLPLFTRLFFYKITKKS